MLGNKLKINDSKTEFLILGTRQQLQKVHIQGLQVGSEQVVPVRLVRNLGVVVDENMSMDKHVAKVASTGYFHLRNIRVIRKYLDHDATCSIIHAFVSSQIDYCNSLLSELPSSLIAKLQRLQNAAARVVFDLKRRDHITPVLRQLHWLPIKYRIKFKVLFIVYKALHNMAPQYIKDMLVQRTNERYSLRSGMEVTLIVPRFKCVTLGRRAFAVNAPILWNSLPRDLRSINNLESFKQHLKSYLFTQFTIGA